MISIDELMNPKRGPGRPRGTGKDHEDAPILAALADYKLKFPRVPDDTAIRRVLRPEHCRYAQPASVVRRIRLKWRRRHKSLLAQARTRRNWNALQRQVTFAQNMERQFLGRAAYELVVLERTRAAGNLEREILGPATYEFLARERQLAQQTHCLAPPIYEAAMEQATRQALSSSASACLLPAGAIDHLFGRAFRPSYATDAIFHTSRLMDDLDRKGFI